MNSTIRKQGSPELSQRADEVGEHENMIAFVGEMFDTMYANKGIGLAANQVGVLKRVIVMHANGLKLDIINPVIVKRYGGTTTSREGCLSFPGQLVSMVRHKQVIVEGFDQNWQPVRRKLKGLAAYCIQHEVDHLDGVTIV